MLEMIGMTVCSGIGAPEYAAPWIDWKYQSEIEPFPCAVLKERFPNAINLGDMTKYEEWPDATIDVLCGGTPCQSFSIAGLRKGLADERGNLMLTYLEIARRYRPRWLVWENVPGVLSSNAGRDFGALLGGLGELGYGFAYRVLDAQYCRTRRYPWAVPQRRRRVFVVGYLGDWRRAAAVLFDGESLSGNPPPRREAGKNLAVSPSLRAQSQCSHRLDSEAYVPDVSPALKARDHKGPSSDGDGDGAPILPVAQGVSLRGREGGGTAELTGSVSTALRASNGGGDKPHVLAFDCKGTEVQCATDGSHPTLRSMGHNNSHQNAGGHAAVAFAENSRAEVRLCGGDGLASSQLTTGGGKPGQGQPTIASPLAVRRLTPVECERLQGFADNWTQIEWRGRPAELCPDGPRYKSIGNSWGVNVGEWIFERIRLVEGMACDA